MEEASFDIIVRDFRATDLTTRNRFVYTRKNWE